MTPRPEALGALPPQYEPLFDRAVAVFSADERVRAMWLHGSLASGHADAASDLDVSVTVADESFDGFAASWREWLARITPTLTARPLRPGSFYAMTPTCERLDVISEPVSKLASTVHRRRIVVFDRDGLGARIPAPTDPPPDPDTITYLVEETLRQATNFTAVHLRDDWLMGVFSVQLVHQALYQLFAESNKPMPATGPKHWSVKLTPAQRRVLSGLPAAAPTRESVLAAREAEFAVFFRDVPPIAQRAGVPWPEELEQAVRSFLADHGLPLPPPAPPATE